MPYDTPWNSQIKCYSDPFTIYQTDFDEYHTTNLINYCFTVSKTTLGQVDGMRLYFCKMFLRKVVFPFEKKMIFLTIQHQLIWNPYQLSSGRSNENKSASYI